VKKFDVAIIGAGAAGMYCAAVAGQRGLRVVLIDHAARIGEKIRISGGGRCNFTNVDVGPANFLSANPHFCRSALARYTPRDFLALLKSHRIAFHEKHRGQLFCDDSAEQIISMLQAECGLGKVAWRTGCTVGAVRRDGAGYTLDTSAGEISAAKLVIATGGLSIPKIGATDFGYRVARQFGLKIIEPRPALVPLTFAGASPRALQFKDLAGVALEADVETVGPYGRGYFREDLLFTHKGLSGPAVLQISTHWQRGEVLQIDLLPGRDIGAELVAAKRGAAGGVAAALARVLPKRLAQALCDAEPDVAGRLLADCPDRALASLGARVNHLTVTPDGTEGFRKAEVTAGGVDTRELSSQTMEALRAPGLHFIGEVVDVTGWLGGYNFQWAWASAVACANTL
jgi:predicted Rossmann fold flavoprotein